MIAVIALGGLVALLALFGLRLLYQYVLRDRVNVVDALVLVYFVTLHLRFNDGRAGAGLGVVQLMKLVIWTAPLLLLVARGRDGRPIARMTRGVEGAFVLFLLLAGLLGVFVGPLAQNWLGVLWLSAGFAAARYLVLRHGLSVFTGFVAAAICTTMLINSVYEIGIQVAGFGAPPQLQGFLGVPRMIGLGVHTNLIGRNAAVLVLIVALSPLFRPWPLAARAPLLGLGGLVLAWSSSRSSLIALAGTVLIVAVVRNASSRGLTFAGVGLILLLGTASNVSVADLQASYGRNGDVNELTTLTGRTDVWRIAARSVGEHPFEGHGFAGSIEGLRQDVEDETGLIWATHAHNWILQTAYATGLVGLALMAVAAGGTVIHLFRPGAAAGFIGAMGAFTVIIGVSESPLGLLQTFLPAMVWMGCVVAASHPESWITAGTEMGDTR